MIYWVNFLHIYQPPGQDPRVLKRVVEESYLTIINLFHAYPLIKITLNVSGSLLEALDGEKEYDGLLLELKNLVQGGRVELVGSAMYHPILSLLPKDEIVR